MIRRHPDIKWLLVATATSPSWHTVTAGDSGGYLATSESRRGTLVYATCSILRSS
ncbi:MAG: hypothetical protein ACR5LD_04175 [Symbiopectobacterium sp.]